MEVRTTCFQMVCSRARYMIMCRLLTIRPGTGKDLDLITQAGCAERQLVWINYKHPQSLLTAQPRLPFIASSSTSAVPCRYSVSYNSSRGPATITKDMFASSAPGYSLKDLRLNIYCATWGGKDVSSTFPSHLIIKCISDAIRYLLTQCDESTQSSFANNISARQYTILQPTL